MRYHLTALFTILVWGLTFVSTKTLLVDFSPLWILLIRFSVGFLCLCIIRPKLMKLKDRKHEWLFVIAGITGIASYYLLENIALVFTTATIVGVIVATAPLFTSLIASFTGSRSALSLRFFVGFATAMAGLACVGIGSDPESLMQGVASSEALLGDGLALLAGLVWAIYSIVLKKISDLGYETIAVTKRTFLWGLLLIAPATLIFGGPLPGTEAFLNASSIGNLLFLGVVASAACFVTWGVAVKHLGAVSASTYIYLVPAINATASIILLGEPLSLPIVVGVVLTILGLVISEKQDKDASLEAETSKAS